MRIASSVVVLVVAAALSGGATTVRAQQRVPLSPHEIHEFDVAGGHFTFNYGRPSKRGREIWGRLVPWRQWWMPGADQATIMTTTKPVAFEGLVVPAGEHTLYMLTAADGSRLVINNQVGQFHTHYEPDRNLGTVKFPWRTVAPIVEQLTIAAAAHDTGGELTLTWDNREYYAAFTVSVETTGGNWR